MGVVCEERMQRAFGTETRIARASVPRRRGPRRAALLRCWLLRCTDELHGLSSLRRSAGRNAHRLSRPLLHGQYCLHTTSLRFAVQRCELPFVVTLHDLVHWDERVEQAAVSLDAAPRDDLRVFRDDETLFFQ